MRFCLPIFLAMRDNRLREGQLHAAIKEAEADLNTCNIQDLIENTSDSESLNFPKAAEVSQKCQKYHNLGNKLNEINVMEDVQLIEKADIVGMTTTGAAKNFKLLKMLVGCKIALIEEAGHVLESHVVTALPPKCKQLILIGDHQQLRPTTSTYHMAKNYGLDISLFERFIKNGFPYSRLEEQHRMRPEIAKIMSTVFYNGLKNHTAVTKYPKNVLGLEKNLFFLTHNYLEQGALEGEVATKSKVNLHESAILLHIARYLLHNGYKKNQITILTTYLGQLFEIRKIQNAKFLDLEGICTAVVDNFQGEENDIILLSLVRSNHEGSIGFLSVQSRVCVALSRARHGLYIVGNMSELASVSSVWKSIRAMLMESDMLGESLQLVCKIHDKNTKTIKVPENFEKLVNRGCEEACNEVLRCGHTCLLLCHTEDRMHSGEVGRCRMECQKSCHEGHPCQKQCYENCYPCQFIGEEITLDCGHSLNMPCPSTVNNTVGGGGYVCKEKAVRTLECGHQVEVYCGDFSIRSTIECLSKCEYLLPCGHPCNLPCHFKQDEGIIGAKSHNKKCMFPCGKLKSKCRRNHICDKMCYQKPCDICTVIIPKTVLPFCNHLSLDLECHQDPTEVICSETCGKSLPHCEHYCQSTCGSCQRRRHQNKLNSKENILSSTCCPPCTEKVERTLECGEHTSIIKVNFYEKQYKT